MLPIHKLDNYLTKSTVNIIVRLLSAFFSLLTISLVARELSKENFGFYAVALSFVMLVTGLLELGFQTSYVSIVSRYDSDKYKQDSIIKAGVFVRLITIVLGTLVIFGIVYMLRFMGIAFPKIPVEFIFLCLLIASGYVIYNFIGAHLRARGSFYFSSLVLSCVPLTQLVVVVALWQTLNLSTEKILAGYAISSLLSIVLLRKLVGVELKGLINVKAYKNDVTTILGFFGAIGFSNLIEVFATRVDIFMIDYMVNQHAVADYFAVQKLASMSMMVSAAITFIILPLLMKYPSWSDVEKREKIVVNYFKMIILMSVLSFFVFAAFGQEALYLIYGPDYVNAYPLLLVKSISISIAFAMSGTAAFLLKNDDELTIVHLAILNTTLLILGNLIFIPILSEFGAVISSVISYAAMFLYAWYKIMRSSLPRGWWKSFINRNIFYLIVVIFITLLSMLLVYVIEFSFIGKLLVLLFLVVLCLFSIKGSYLSLIDEIG